jgi:hypothetical protein
MADKVKVWFDKEGDFLEVTFAGATAICAKQRMMQSWSGWIRAEK